MGCSNSCMMSRGNTYHAVGAVVTATSSLRPPPPKATKPTVGELSQCSILSKFEEKVTSNTLGELCDEARHTQICRALGPTGDWVLDEQIASKSLRLLHSRIEFYFKEEAETGHGARGAWQDIQKLFSDHFWPCPKASPCTCGGRRGQIGRPGVDSPRNPAKTPESAAEEMQRKIRESKGEVPTSYRSSSSSKSEGRRHVPKGRKVETEAAAQGTREDTTIKAPPAGNGPGPLAAGPGDLDQLLQRGGDLIEEMGVHLVEGGHQRIRINSRPGCGPVPKSPGIWSKRCRELPEDPIHVVSQSQSGGPGSRPGLPLSSFGDPDKSWVHRGPDSDWSDGENH